MNKFYLRHEKSIILFLLLVMLIFEVFSAIGDSQTMDEAVHISAGYSYLKKFDFRMNPEHPPLIKYLSAAPLLLLKLNGLDSYDGWQQRIEWSLASEFIYHNRVPANLIIYLSRLPIMILSLLLGIFIYKWSKELFGIKVGYLTLLLYVFCPNFLANSRLVTTDLGVTFFFILTIYYFGKYLKKPDTKNLLISAIIFGLAQLSKFSAIILFPTLIILYFIRWWQVRFKKQYNIQTLDMKEKENVNNYSFSLNNFLLTFLIIVIVTGLMIFIFYGLEIKKPLDDPQVLKLYDKRIEIINNKIINEQSPLTQKLIYVADPQTKLGKYIFNIAKYTPIPAYSYLRGAIQLFFHNYNGHLSFLMGSYNNYGWWYYFPIAFLIKTPITILIFLIISIIIFFIKIYKNKKRLFKYFKEINFNFYLLLIPVIIYFLWSITSNLNLGLRHILPIFPLLYILFGYLFLIIVRNKKVIYKIIITVLFIFYIFSSVKIYPFYLSYFNELIGGPKNGHKYLLDSNIDWGQDLIRLRKYMDNKNISTFYLKYFGSADVNYYFPKNKYNILEVSKEEKNLDYTVAISITDLLSKDGVYKWLLNHKKIDSVGYSIYIFGADIK